MEVRFGLASAVIALAFVYGWSPSRGDDLLYRYEGDVLPYDASAGWLVFNPCEGPCSESLSQGHFLLNWVDSTDLANYHYWIARPGETPPATLWVEWRYRSDTPFRFNAYTCDARFSVQYKGVSEALYIFGDAAISGGANNFVVGLNIEEFHTYRYESLDGINFRISVDGLVFIDEAQDEPFGSHYVQIRGEGGCVPEDLPTLNEWDFVRYGTISYGEQIIATDPPQGFLDAGAFDALDRFTITFDSPNYVYLDDISVEVTGGVAPSVTQTRRLDNGHPEVVEIVLDGPLPINETTRFTFNDGTAVNVVEYTVTTGGACCALDGSCQELSVPDCELAGGTFVGGLCEGDADGDGVDGACGDPCPNDAPNDTDGDGVCDSVDPCPLDNPDDTDGDGVCDSLDPCPLDNPDDTDADGVCDSDDPCPIDNPDDTDADGVCDSNDPCPIDNPDDTDNDGVCDSVDACPTNPDFAADPGPCNCSSSDLDADGVLDCLDVCPGFDDNLDTDGDGVRDCQDVCPGADDAVFASECTVAIPTTTAWGLVVLGLLLLVLAKVAWARHQRAGHPVS